MNINPKELQRFHDLWAPMMAALPAVINAAERANELQNHVLQLEARVKEALAATEHAVAARNATLAQLSEQLDELREQKKQLDAQVKTHKFTCEERVKRAEADAAVRISGHTERANAAEQASRAALGELTQRKAAVVAEYDAVIAAKVEEVKEIETRALKAQESLERLRAKLG